MSPYERWEIDPREHVITIQMRHAISRRVRRDMVNEVHDRLERGELDSATVRLANRLVEKAVAAVFRELEERHMIILEVPPRHYRPGKP